MSFRTERTKKLEGLIEEMLPADSRLIRIYTAKNNQSFYCLLAHQSNYFKVIRVSDHPTQNRRLDVPTFIWRKNPQFQEQLMTFIQADNSWFKIRYNEYVVILYILRSKRLSMRFCLEKVLGVNYYGFYADVFSGRNYQERKTLPEDFQKILKKLYLRGVLNVYKKNLYQQVYITSIGMALLNSLKSVYPQWEKDKHNLNYYQFELPDGNVQPVIQAENKKGKTEDITWSDLKKQGLHILSECGTWFKMLSALIKKRLTPKKPVSESNKKEMVNKEIFFDDKKENHSQNKSIQKGNSKPIKQDLMKEPIAKRSQSSMDGLLNDETLSALQMLKEEIDQK